MMGHNTVTLREVKGRALCYLSSKWEAAGRLGHVGGAAWGQVIAAELWMARVGLS